MNLHPQSDNASMPYVSGNYAALYEFIQRQNQWFQYGDRVWVNHIDYVTQCTSFAFSSVDVTDCNQKNSFICEIGEHTHGLNVYSCTNFYFYYQLLFVP